MPASAPPDAPPRRILVIRVSALGDIVFATSLLDGLRDAFPDAHIAWLVQPAFAGVLEGDPRIDEVIRMPPKALASIGGAQKLRRLLATRETYDWVIDAQGLLKTRIATRLAPAKKRIGFVSKEPAGFLVDRLLPKGGDIAEIASEYRYLAEKLTGRPAGPPRLVPSAQAQARVADAMRTRALQPGFVALCPFTTRPQKHWFETYWPDLATRLAARGLGPCVLLGGPGDREAAARILAAMPAGTVDLVGATPLSDVSAWLSQAGVVIGVDTGLTHIGIAVDRPVVALFGSTCPYTRGSRAPLRVLYDALPCAPCKRNPTCDGVFMCMRDLTPERVAVATAQLVT